MIIEQLFKKPITREIDPVIDATNEAKLTKELEEYVITEEIANNLHDFLEAYTGPAGENGVWISGFFGSGKSHLLKILSAVLEQKRVDGQRADKLFIEKATTHPMLKGKLDKVSEIPSESILFNIDHNANNISKDDNDAVLAVFLKMFDDHCGYFGNQPYIANFERDLDKGGLFEAFKETVKALTRKDWGQVRRTPHIFVKQIDAAFNTVTGQQVSKILKEYKETFTLSIKDFGRLVKEYIDKKDKEQPGFRLNFFVDEVGQFVAERVNLMTNIQSLAETLKTQCKGRAWIIVTAQEDMETVIGEYGVQQSNDFSKIQDRYKIRMKLKSSDVEEVIQKRLLEKTEEANTTLMRQYNIEYQNFNTLFSFTDGTRTYRNYRDGDEFCKLYPFIPYQFKLFQSAIRSLSDHNAFEGKHSSVGERPMLDVFRKVTIALKDKDSTDIATFDRMFEGIRKRLKSSVQQSITDAESNFGTASLETRLLKTLLLVKYIKEFKADIDNLTTLMLERFDQKKTELKASIQKILNRLETETYIQKVGNLYEYLTDEEKDVENEIKNLIINKDAISSEMQKILFNEILPEKSIKYNKTSQIIPFTRKLDDIRYGNENGEIAINIISPLHEDAGKVQRIQTLKMKENEMTLIMAADDTLLKDIRLYLQTTQYARQSRSEELKESRKKIIDAKISQNNTRKKDIRLKLEDLLSDATILVKSTVVNSKGSKPKERLEKCFQELIEQTYINLKMLNQKQYDEADIQQLLNSGNRIGIDTEQKEAKAELEACLNRQTSGTRVTVRHITEQFKKIPYGWGENDIAYLLALLYKQNKIEFSVDSNIIESEALAGLLTNTRKKEHIVIKLLKAIPDWQKKKLTGFYRDYFNSPPSPDAKTLALDTRKKIGERVDELVNLEIEAARYPFAQRLKDPIDTLKAMRDREYTWFLSEIDTYADKLMDDKEDVIDKINAFMTTNQKTIYDEAKKFLADNRHNRTMIPNSAMDDIEALLNTPDCYNGHHMKRVKELMKDEADKLSHILTQTKKNLKTQITKNKNKVLADPDYARLKPEQQREIEADFVRESDRVERESVIANLQLTGQTIQTTFLPEEIQKLRKYSYSNNGGNGDQPAAAPTFETFNITNFLKDRFDDNTIKTDEDLNHLITTLKTELETKIKSGKEIYIV